MDVKDSGKYRSPFAVIGAQVALAVTWVSGLFSLVLCVVIILNHLYVTTADPLNDKSLAALKAAIAKDLENRELRDSVRDLYMLSQRAFFTSQNMLNTAGLLLLGSCAVFLASIKTRMELKRVNPVPVGAMPMEGGAAERSMARWAVAAGAGVLVAFTLFVVYVNPAKIELQLPEAEPAAAAATTTEPAKAVELPVPAPAPVSGATAVQPSQTWPQFRGPGGLGVASHKNAPLAWNGKTQEGILWKTPIPKPGTSSVVAWGKKVYVTGSDEKTLEVYAYDVEKGTLAWTGSVPATAAAPPKIMDGTTFAANTAAADADHVYAIFNTGDIAAFTHDGKRVWAKNLGPLKISYGYTSSLAVAGGRVFVQYDDDVKGRLIALDGKTGNPAWEQKREVISSWSTPAVADVGGRVEILINANPWVSGHDPKTGKANWSVKCMKGEVAPSPAFAGGVGYFVTDHAAMVAIQLGGEGKILWQVEDGLPDASSPVATATHVFMCSSSGLITCLDAKTGASVWTQEFDEGFYGSPILVDDRLYVMDRAGTTHVFKAGPKYEVLATNPLGEKADCTPAIPEGRLYLRSEKHIYCVGKSGT